MSFKAQRTSPPSRAPAPGGVYHVLHGVIALLDGVGPDDLKIPELLSRMESSEVTEVVLATGASVEGEATAVYLSRLLSPLCTVTRLCAAYPPAVT